jgi:hypothetical protein
MVHHRYGEGGFTRRSARDFAPMPGVTLLALGLWLAPAGRPFVACHLDQRGGLASGT